MNLNNRISSLRGPLELYDDSNQLFTVQVDDDVARATGDALMAELAPIRDEYARIATEAATVQPIALTAIRAVFLMQTVDASVKTLAGYRLVEAYREVTARFSAVLEVGVKALDERLIDDANLAPIQAINKEIRGLRGQIASAHSFQEIDNLISSSQQFATLLWGTVRDAASAAGQVVRTGFDFARWVNENKMLILLVVGAGFALTLVGRR